jgi:hypothetical protein
MAKLKTQRIKSTTIIEALVAMTISLVYFSLATSLFVQLTVKSASLKKIKAHEMLNQYALNTIDQRAYFDADTSNDNVILQKRFFSVDSMPGLIRAKFSVLEGGSLLEETEKLINTKEQ